MADTGDNGYDDSSKRVKYDRQLRLWDDHGQHALEAAHVCLINATATGTEILKSLVLPGIGAFTILDGEKISGQDAGNNFFFDKDSVGQSRAKVSTKYLLELNPDVRGEFVDETLESTMKADPNFFSKFSVVIATGVTEGALLRLADTLWDQGVPLLVCRSYGLIGYLRLQASDRTIIESRPENEYQDLRLDQPFSALREYVDSIDLDQLTDQEHSHVPYVVILLKALDVWRQNHDGEMPKNSKEKNLFKAEIMKGMRKKEDENFEEACRAVNRAITKTCVPSEVNAILNDPLCSDLNSESKSFWILCRALKEFVEHEGNGSLPVRGVIPDMLADTQSYIKLQNIYKKKAEEDSNCMLLRVQEILNNIGKSQDSITEHEIKTFCKNSYCLRVLHGRSLKEEYDCKTSRIQNLIANLEHEDSDIIFYALLRAADKFYTEYCRFPGQSNDDVESDIIKIKNCLSQLTQEWNCPSIMKDDYIHEICRWGGAEIHSVAAFVGGTAAQEVIKLITGQYVPFNNTLIYSAITHNVSTYCL
ncbi:NEDD8-activating enzyme E1 regulatory subunit-like [Uloborus diversus]|uniref:NEDD8-activating enzyme E1 regulatory subunit-like n=1 Tax=Uloborus diversus TaxID=327109 RepID=UPI00240A9A22|nr:NEDD8-activating enzyme E1 regulatory subunit-like [Uloborus diversus]